MWKKSIPEVLEKAVKHLEKKGVLVFESNPVIKGYSLHHFGKTIKALIVLKKDTDINMLLVLSHEVGHLFKVTDRSTLIWKPDEREEIANARAIKLLQFIHPVLVSRFKSHYTKSLKERKASEVK